MKQIVIMPGGFHPFHAGHYALYKSAVEAFPDADVYVAATNDQKARPFPFAIKEKLAKLAGVATGRFIQVKSPFKANEITDHYDPSKDVLIFVRSEKDKTEQPQPGGTKKDGSPAYFQPWTGKNLQSFNKHAYIAYLPTVEFGPGIKSATEIRNAWPNLNDRQKTAMVMSLYPATQKNRELANNVVQMLDIGMGGEVTESVNEDVNSNYLYHSTEDANTAKAILQSGYFQAGNSSQDATDAQIGDVKSISFGRNFGYQTSGSNVGRNYQVVFVVDRKALESKHKTIATSQSADIRGLGYGSGIQSGKQQNKDSFVRNQIQRKVTFNRGMVDTNKDNVVSKDEIEANPDIHRRYYQSKAGNEFEEVVPVKSGKLPWKGMLVGFYLVPGKAASKDPELLNHPLRLDMPRPNTFVKANQQNVAESSTPKVQDYLEEN